MPKFRRCYREVVQVVSRADIDANPYPCRYRKLLALHTFPKAPSRAIVNFERENIRTRQKQIMRWILSFLLLGLLSAVSALSSDGNKLLVVLEELSEKSKYSKYLGDLEGK